MKVKVSPLLHILAKRRVCGLLYRQNAEGQAGAAGGFGMKRRIMAQNVKSPGITGAFCPSDVLAVCSGQLR